MDQEKVGRFLQMLRKEKEITQEALAEQLGVSNRSVSRWENGRTMPDFDLMVELASYYEVDVGEILMGERKKSGQGAETEEMVANIVAYSNVEKAFFSKRMCAMFLIALAGMVIFMGIDLLGLSGMEPYESIVSVALGFVIGTLLTGLLYSSRYIVKLKNAKVRFQNRLHGTEKRES